MISKNDRTGIVCGTDGCPINIRGELKVKQAIQALSQFGLISFSRNWNFKSSVYTIHFIKPVAKLKQLVFSLIYFCVTFIFQICQKSVYRLNSFFNPCKAQIKLILPININSMNTNTVLFVLTVP